MRDDVEREALHDWLDQRDALRADAMPDRSEYEDQPSVEDEEYDAYLDEIAPEWGEAA